MARGQGEGTISLFKNGLYCGRLTVGYDANGKQKRKAIYGKTKKEVQEKMNLVKVALANNSYIEPSRLPLGEWLDQWLVDYKKRTVRNSSYNLYHRWLNYYIKPAIGAVKLKDLSAEIVQKFINNLSDSGLKRKTIQNITACLSSALNQAVKSDLISFNPARFAVLPQSLKGEIRVLSVDEQQRFIRAADHFSYGNLYVFMLATGTRSGEARALTWRDIDFDTGSVSINKTFSASYNMDEKKTYRYLNPAKTGAGNRTLPIVPNVLERLCKIKQNTIFNDDDDLVFSNNGTMINDFVARSQLKEILREANLEDGSIHLHTLRHTFATRGLENGIELIVMKELLGHSSISMTADIYTHVMPDKKMDSIMKIADTIIL